MVIDTKWKLLSPGKKGRNGVAEADLYQLYAYARRYGCARSVLLYPHTNGLEASDFHVLDADGALSSERISVRQIRLQGIHQDHQRQNLTRELEVILREGLEPFGGRSPRS
jgi:5-methylcytosine-specific restriction endonuclease McrBC regulatory subunit McrC